MTSVSFTCTCRVCSVAFHATTRWADECPTCAVRLVESCAECGRPDNAQYSFQTRERMLTRSLCFDCLFWFDRIEAVRSDPSSFIAAGNSYVDGGNKLGRDGSPHLGSYGDRFRIEFNDGRVVETNNLWCQGPIPERFRDRLLDTARLEPVPKGVKS